MIRPDTQIDVYLCREPVDKRKSIDGLSLLVQEVMALNPFEQAVFVFCNRQRDKVKILALGRDGFVLWYKRLEQERFKWPDRLQGETLTLSGQEPNWIFLVIGSPVTEVGRHHDYDWASVEPSSLHSLIQLIGRIRRHRLEPYSAENVAILSKNVRALKKASGPAYNRPGFPTDDYSFKAHDLRFLRVKPLVRHLDARPRILQPERPDLCRFQNDLCAMEHLGTLIICPGGHLVRSGLRGASAGAGGAGIGEYATAMRVPLRWHAYQPGWKKGRWLPQVRI